MRHKLDTTQSSRAYRPGDMLSTLGQIQVGVNQVKKRPPRETRLALRNNGLLLKFQNIMRGKGKMSIKQLCGASKFSAPKVSLILQNLLISGNYVERVALDFGGGGKCLYHFVWVYKGIIELDVVALAELEPNPEENINVHTEQ